MPITPVFGGSAPTLVPPGTPAPVALVAGSTALTSTFIGSWSDAVTVTASVAVDDASPAPTATVTGTGAGPYSVAIASGLSDGRVYAVTLTGQDSFGQFAEVTLSVAVATAGASKQWLNIPSKVIYIENVPSPDPGAYTWDQPTNGIAPFTYEGYVVGGTPLNGQWNFFNYTNRTIRLTRPVGMTSNGQQPMLIRIRAFDSVGNFGDQYIMVLYMTSKPASEITILPETVLEESDPALNFTFPPHLPGWVGDQFSSPWLYQVGSGKLSPSPMKNATIGPRHQGPFVVDPAPGAALIFMTCQNGGGAGQQILIKPVRRKRALAMTTTNAPWQNIIDYDLGVIGAAAPSSFTTPLTGTVQRYVAQWTQPGFGADGMTIEAYQQTAGTSTSEAVAFNASGASVQLADTAASARAIQLNFIPRISTTYNNPNTAPLALRADCIPTADDVVVRMVVRMTLSGVAATTQVGIVGQGGAAIRIAQAGVAVGGVPAANMRMLQVQAGGGYRPAGQIYNTEFNGLDFGYDIYVSNGSRNVVVYAWPGDWPDLAAQSPYGGLLHWTTEGISEQSSGNSQQNFTVGYGSEAVANNSDWTYGQMFLPRVRIEARLGSAPGNIDILVKRFRIDHRPRMLVQES